MDRMDLMAHRRASDNAVLASYDYTYRADGKRTGLNESFSTTTARSNSYTWSYDNAGRLISEVLDSSDNSIDQTESYVYDLVGNRMRKEVNKPATAYVDQVFAYNYDANDRITSETLDNGANGAGVDSTTTYGWTQTLQTSKTVSVPSVSSVVQSMSYGLGGQLEQVVTTTQNGSGTVTGRTRVDYRYTPQGIRTISVDWNDANLDGTFAAGERTGSVEYLIDNANFTGYQQTILETVKNAAGQATKRTTYTFGTDEITQTVSQIDSSSQLITQSSTLTFAHDGKGSVRALFGAAAAIAQVFTYSAYGELLAIHNGSGTLQPLTSSLTSVLYNGEGFDARTGLYNMRARWYSASNARWERLDPFAGNPNDPFSFNKYGFVHGNPIGMTDPTGLFGVVGGAIGVSAGVMKGIVLMHQGFAAQTGETNQLARFFAAMDFSDPLSILDFHQFYMETFLGELQSEMTRGIGVAANAANHAVQVVEELMEVNLELVFDLSISSFFARACFPGDTKVLVADRESGEYSTRRIDEVKVGDVVVSRNENDEDGPVTLRTVEEVFSREAEELWRVVFSDDEGKSWALRTTEGHPFFVKGKGWVEASDLQDGDLLSDPTGKKTLRVIECDCEPIEEKHRVFTLRVATDHTFFVVPPDSEVEFAVWVHNSCRNAAAAYEDNARLAHGIAKDQARGLRVFSGATKSGQRIADGVKDLASGGRMALESKYIKDWAKSIYNPASKVGSKSFAQEVVKGLAKQAKDYSNAFKQVVYQSNSKEFLDVLKTQLSADEAIDMSSFIFKLVP